jgi:phosphotriesterase-related protein
LEAVEGAAEAALRSAALMEIHTEKGALAEKACIYFLDRGLAPAQLVLCHMDKRPDLGLHKELARLGVLLEYDTFYRPKYEPQARLWPLLVRMAEAGLAGHVALATDMAEAELYRSLGGGPGLASLPGEIRKQLGQRGIPEAAQQQMLGGNIARRLAGIN